MTTRLDLQRPPGQGRTHKRSSGKLNSRGYTGPHAPWGDGSACPTNIYPTGYQMIVASNGTEAAKLAGLGFVANPTSAWTTGQGISVNSFAFNWSGSAWAAGNHA